MSSKFFPFHPAGGKRQDLPASIVSLEGPQLTSERRTELPVAVEKPEELLSRDQIETEFGISRRWLEMAAHRGNGPPMVRISRRMVRYRRRDVIDFIASRRVCN